MIDQKGSIKNEGCQEKEFLILVGQELEVEQIKGQL
jgi:hypothetical protein